MMTTKVVMNEGHLIPIHPYSLTLIVYGINFDTRRHFHVNILITLVLTLININQSNNSGRNAFELASDETDAFAWYIDRRFD